MDMLLLTCHFMFEQKQISLQTPCSRDLGVLLTGSDLFTQPLDKVALLAHPGATPSPPSPPFPPSTTSTFLFFQGWDLMVFAGRN